MPAHGLREATGYEKSCSHVINPSSSRQHSCNSCEKKVGVSIHCHQLQMRGSQVNLGKWWGLPQLSASRSLAGEHQSSPKLPSSPNRTSRLCIIIILARHPNSRHPPITIVTCTRCSSDLFSDRHHPEYSLDNPSNLLRQQRVRPRCLLRAPASAWSTRTSSPACDTRMPCHRLRTLQSSSIFPTLVFRAGSTRRQALRPVWRGSSR